MKINEQSTPFRAAELGAVLARYYPRLTPHHAAKLVAEMQSAARTAKRWEVDRCNVPMTEKQEESGHAQLQRLQDGLNAKLAEVATAAEIEAATVLLGGDPRGPCARLSIPGERGDGWGDGYAIY